MMKSVPNFPSLACLLLSFLLACPSKEKSENLSAQKSQPAVRIFSGGPCEDCDLMFAGMPVNIHSSDTTKGWNEPGQKLMISGHVYKKDMSTPVRDVILYYYHTNTEGLYAAGEGMDEKARRHGYLRGWVKSGPDGSFRIHTLRPAQYPENTIEAHIHVIVKEPDMDIPYWIDAWVFDDDPLLTPEMRKRMENFGGSGIMKTKLENGIQVAEQNVYLGLNIPGYPD